MLSLIIPTKNEQQNITNCLESIKQQSFDKEKIEVIMVDNNSEDSTKEIAREYTLHYKDAGQTVKVFNCGPERSAQRNFGAQKAQGEIIGFIDADMILSANVIAEVVEKFEQDKNLVGLYINERIINIPTGFSQGIPPLKGVGNFWCKIRNFERQFYNMTPVDAVRFMRRDVFFESGGFDENLFACEDWDLQKRLNIIAHESGRHFDLLKSIIFHNEKEKTLKHLMQKKRYYSGSFAPYIKKWGRADSNVKKQFGFWYRFFGVFIEQKKWHRLVSHPILTAAMFFSKVLIGANYLKRKNKI